MEAFKSYGRMNMFTEEENSLNKIQDLDGDEFLGKIQTGRAHTRAV
jgi:hypothetical protein